MSKSLCIIPARGGSKRFPGKNTALLNGKPLVAYAIDVAKESGVFDTVCVTSDDPAVLTIARERGVDIVHDRPADLATDTAQLRTVCLRLLEELAAEGKSYDSFALLVPVSPLRTAAQIRAAAKLLQSSDADTVLSVTAHIHPPQRALCIRKGHIEPFSPDDVVKRAQELETLYYHDGTVMFCKTKQFLESGEFYATNIVPYEIPAGTSVNIDDPSELAWAEFLSKRFS